MSTIDHPRPRLPRAESSRPRSGGSLRARRSRQRALYLAALSAAVLAPLAVAALADPFEARRPFAHELGVAFGFVAFAVFLVELALVARLRRASEPFGTDVLMRFHRLLALLALLFASAHAILLARAGGSRVVVSGGIAIGGAFLIVVTSILRKRLRLRYELWRSLHLWLAIVLVLAAAAHLVAAKGYSRTPAVAWVACAYAVGFLALLAQYRLIRPWRLLRRPWRVVENRDEGADTRTLALEPEGHGGFDFAPGQFAWLNTGSTPFHREQHPLSFSSSAERASDGAIEFSIKALGDWSGDIRRIAPGARAWVDGPFGAFTPDRTDARAFALVAGGIGVSPMRSMLLTFRDRRESRPIVLFYAANRPERTVFRAELERLERELDLEVVYVYESPPAGWEGERGRVTADVLLRHLHGDLASWEFFVCGPPRMMDDVELVLRRIGVDAGRVHSERFDLV